jgi:cyclophilin family peptidyl-prolyl cis-trans isomerase
MQSVTLHTNVGELKCEIFCDEVPKTAEVCVSLHSPSASVSLSNYFFLSLYLMRPQQQAVI